MTSMSQSRSTLAGQGQQALQEANEGRGRILLQNVNGFTDERSSEIRSFLEEDQNNGWLIIMLTEVNVDWRVSFQSFKSMTRWHSQRHIVFGHNCCERKDRLFQPGGVAIVSLGAAAARILKTEADPSGLGRWCGVQYQLKSSTLWVVVL